MEVGFAVMGVDLRGDATAGWIDSRKQYRFRLEWSENLTEWFQGFFLPCADQPEAQEDGSLLWWSRSQFPMSSEASVSKLVAYHPQPLTLDNPITGIRLDGDTVALDYPYTLPDDLDRLQLDLRAADLPGALCQAVGENGWQVTIPALGIAGTGTNDLQWPAHDIGSGVMSSGIEFGLGSYNAAGVATNLPRQFARLGVSRFHQLPPSNTEAANFGTFYQSELQTAPGTPVIPNPPAPTGPATPSAAFIAFAQTFIAGVDSRLEGKTPSGATRDVLSTKNHVTPNYVRNAGLWCAELAATLTGVVMRVRFHVDMQIYENGGGVAVTSRHLLGCRHWHWGTGDVVGFVLADGSLIERTIIHTANHPSLDLSIWLLDSALPEGVHISRVMPPLTYQQQQFMVALQVPDICVCQGTTAPRSAYPGWQNATGTLPNSQERMVYPGAAYLGYYSPPSAARLPWWHSPYPGDSGTCRFLANATEAVLCAITSGATVGENIASINTLITACDDGAIAAEVLDARTNLSLTVATLTIPSA